MPRAKISIRERGVRQTVEKLRAVGDAAFEQAPTFADLAKDAPNAVSKVARRTGRLSDSLKDGAAEQYKKVTPFGYDIGTTVYYAGFVFRGTKNMTAQKPRVARKRLQDAAKRKVATDIINAR